LQAIFIIIIIIDDFAGLPELFCTASVTADGFITSDLAFMYDEVVARRAPTYYASFSIYQPNVNGTFLSHISMAAHAYDSVHLYVSGPPPDYDGASAVSLPNAYNGVITTSHTYMLAFSLPNQVITTAGLFDGPRSYSDPTGKQTSWSVVRLEDFLSQPMTAFAVAYTATSCTTLGVIQFDKLDVNAGGAFDMTTWTFSAPLSGVYVLGMTAAVTYGSTTLDITINVNGAVVFELMKLSHVAIIDSRQTVSRTVAVNLNANDKVTVNLVYGGFYSDIYRHTAFTG
jgi:hypothetical protein